MRSVQTNDSESLGHHLYQLRGSWSATRWRVYCMASTAGNWRDNFRTLGQDGRPADQAGLLQILSRRLALSALSTSSISTTLVFEMVACRAAVFVGEAPAMTRSTGTTLVGEPASSWTDDCGHGHAAIRCVHLQRGEMPPSQNRTQHDEVAACSPFLFRQIEAIRPRVICLLGNYATQTLLQTPKHFSVAGKDRYWRGIPVIAPSSSLLLRNPAQRLLPGQT